MTESCNLFDCYQVCFNGPSSGNPYLDVSFEAIFENENLRHTVPGFYDGNSVYKFRFMPDAVGQWQYRTISNVTSLNGMTGALDCTPARRNAHGPVRVRNTYHFAYADGTPFMPFGTTCYAWTHQPIDEQEKTLETLRKTRFNKVRMSPFPKDYPFNSNEPLHLCFALKGDGTADFDQPNFKAFQHFDRQVKALMESGIEADVILFHPYDRWGYCNMSAEQDCRYVAYLAARLSGYRNVWWSLANEYDFLLNTKPMELWDHFFRVLNENDHVHHLRSIHNGDVRMNFDHRKTWVDHVCIQNPDVKQTQSWRDMYGKPIVNDEPEYEGDIIHSWGNITAQELVHRYWITLLRGGYCGHGETYSHPDDKLWWAKGGRLHGEAWKRIGFLRDLLEMDVKHGLTPMGPVTEWPWSRVSAASDGRVRFIYFGEHQPKVWTLGLPRVDGNYRIDLIDTWNMTVTPVEKCAAPRNHPLRHGEITRTDEPDAAFGVKLPGKPNLALRIREL